MSIFVVQRHFAEQTGDLLKVVFMMTNTVRRVGGLLLCRRLRVMLIASSSLVIPGQTIQLNQMSDLIGTELLFVFLKKKRLVSLDVE